MPPKNLNKGFYSERPREGMPPSSVIIKRERRGSPSIQSQPKEDQSHLTKSQRRRRRRNAKARAQSQHEYVDNQRVCEYQQPRESQQVIQAQQPEESNKIEVRTSLEEQASGAQSVLAKSSLESDTTIDPVDPPDVDSASKEEEPADYQDANGYAMNVFLRRHEFPRQSTYGFVTSERRAYERDVYDYARQLGMTKAEAKLELVNAREFCYELNYDTENSSWEHEEDDTTTVIKQEPHADNDLVDNSSEARMNETQEVSLDNPVEEPRKVKKKVKSTKAVSDYFTSPEKKDNKSTSKKRKRVDSTVALDSQQIINEEAELPCASADAWVEPHTRIKKKLKKKKRQDSGLPHEPEEETGEQGEPLHVPTDKSDELRARSRNKSKKGKQADSIAARKPVQVIEDQVEPLRASPGASKGLVVKSKKEKKRKAKHESFSVAQLESAVTDEGASSATGRPRAGSDIGTASNDNEGSSIIQAVHKEDKKMTRATKSKSSTPLQHDKFVEPIDSTRNQDIDMSEDARSEYDGTLSLENDVGSSSAAQHPSSPILGTVEVDTRHRGGNSMLQEQGTPTPEALKSEGKAVTDRRKFIEALSKLSIPEAAFTNRHSISPTDKTKAKAKQILTEQAKDIALSQFSEVLGKKGQNCGSSQQQGRESSPDYLGELDRLNSATDSIQSPSASNDIGDSPSFEGPGIGDGPLEPTPSPEQRPTRHNSNSAIPPNDSEPEHVAQVLSSPLSALPTSELVRLSSPIVRPRSVSKNDQKNQGFRVPMLRQSIPDDNDPIILSDSSSGVVPSLGNALAAKRSMNAQTQPSSSSTAVPIVPSPSPTRTKTTSHFSTFFDQSKQFKPSYVKCPHPDVGSFGLVQERFEDQPFKLLVAVILLNQTKGEAAIPLAGKLFSVYGTPHDLAATDEGALANFLRPIGLNNKRAALLIKFARAWLNNSPQQGKRYRKIDYPEKGNGRNINPDEHPLHERDPRPAWEIAHLPGMGPYALDSWRIFCRDRLRGISSGLTPLATPQDRETEENQEWTRVVPLDKELRVYVRWRWLRLGKLWEPFTKRTLQVDRKIIEAMYSEGLRGHQGFYSPWINDPVAERGYES